jgi:hypothetical protein
MKESMFIRWSWCVSTLQSLPPSPILGFQCPKRILISDLPLPFIIGVNKCEFRPRHRISAPGCRISASGAGFCASGVKTEWKAPQAQKILPGAWNRKSSSTFFLCKYLQTSALFLHELGYNTSKNTWNWSSFNVMTNVINAHQQPKQPLIRCRLWQEFFLQQTNNVIEVKLFSV